MIVTKKENGIKISYELCKRSHISQEIFEACKSLRFHQKMQISLFPAESLSHFTCDKIGRNEDKKGEESKSKKDAIWILNLIEYI